MKDTVLGFKYWIDEPGDTVMYMGSEKSPPALSRGRVDGRVPVPHRRVFQ